MKIIYIVSPVNGIVTDIGPDTITINIRPNDKHHVYGPLDGLFVDISSQQGSWYRHVFHANVNKIARTTISIKNIQLNAIISFWLEVGKPKYITDRIRLDRNVGDIIHRGELIGEIILGSLAEVHFNGLPHQTYVTRGSILVGGRTVVAYIMLLELE